MHCRMKAGGLTLVVPELKTCVKAIAPTPIPIPTPATTPTPSGNAKLNKTDFFNWKMSPENGTSLSVRPPE